VGSVLPPPPPGLVAAAAAQQSGRAWPQPTMIPQSAPSMVSGAVQFVINTVCCHI
ncbi:unnamed protein product, partial [Cercopithifilaria johnstoni]